jgi:hypothetical protein
MGNYFKNLVDFKAYAHLTIRKKRIYKPRVFFNCAKKNVCIIAIQFSI